MEYDRYTTDLRAAYEGFANGLLAEYLALRAGAAPASAITPLRRNGLILVTKFMHQANYLTQHYLAAMPDGDDTRMRAQPYLHQLKQIATGNLNELLVRLAGAPRLADVLTRPAGAIGELLQRRVSKPELMAKDTAGRNWKAEQLVATLARDFAYQAYVDGELARLDERGVEVIELSYLDATHKNHGMTLRLDEVDLVRKKIFHPNATARIKEHVQA